jgi:hypothetical protein
MVQFAFTFWFNREGLGYAFSSSGALLLVVCVCVFFLGSHTWPVVESSPGRRGGCLCTVGLVDDCVFENCLDI